MWITKYGSPEKPELAQWLLDEEVEEAIQYLLVCRKMDRWLFRYWDPSIREILNSQSGHKRITITDAQRQLWFEHWRRLAYEDVNLEGVKRLAAL